MVRQYKQGGLTGTCGTAVLGDSGCCLQMLLLFCPRVHQLLKADKGQTKAD
jgi:hypothetical protein